ncbi:MULTISPECIES: hypothetical protein [unclassified Streptomyces]|uniref:hypothetical protein n=1 Tax=unclassified Streptomyces TaxID=2593676 RepID=UPI002E348D18|nr:hypothetical protein [Streptomyces sp. NBC_01268]
MSVSRNSALAGAVAVAALMTLAAPSGAAAATTGADGGKQHCTVRPGQRAATCFDTFAEAIAHATNGAVRLPAGARTVTQRQLDAAAGAKGLGATGATVIAVVYNDANFAGHSFTFVKDHGCDGDWGTVEFEEGNLRYFNDNTNFNWGDEIGSAQEYSGCHGIYYENSWFNTRTSGRTVEGPWSGGWMDDEASSIRWV